MTRNTKTICSVLALLVLSASISRAGDTKKEPAQIDHRLALPNDANKELANIDPRLSLANDAKKKTEVCEELLSKNMAELFELVDQKLNSLPDSIADEQAAMTALLEATRRLNELAKALIERYQGYLDNSVQYKKALESAPPIFRQAAQTNIEYADQESYASIADDYRTLAAAWEAMAKVYEKRAKDITKESDIKETMEFVKRSSIFLDRLETHILVYPTSSEPQIHREAFLRQLRTYIEGFESLRERIRALHDQFQKTVDPDNTTGHKHIESLSLYVGEFKVVCPNSEKAKTVKASLTEKNIPFDDKPFNSDKFFNLIGDERAPVQAASYESKKMKTVPELVDKINRLQQATKPKENTSAPPQRTIPNRDRTTRYAPPPQRYLPPPPVFVVYDDFLPGLDEYQMYPPPMPVVYQKGKYRHR